MNKIDKLISIIRNLKEEGMSIGAPTNNTGSTSEVAGYSEKSPSPTAGYPKPLGRDGRSKLMRRLPPGYRKFFAKKRKLNKSKKNK
jgi:hypothetical protein